MFNQQLFFAIDELVQTPSRNFYENLFDNLDLSNVQPTKIAHTGRKSTDFHALIRSVIVMKCERFSEISDLWDYLNNNRIIAHLCGFGFKVPSYSVLQRFIKNLDPQILEQLMRQQVQKCQKLGLIDAKTIALDSTPIYANVANNNSKTFMNSKFSKQNPPKGDRDCKLGFHANSNALGEQKGEYYWGYKEHILLDVVSGLPICSMTTGANTHDSAVALEILAKTHTFTPITGCNFIGDMAFDCEKIYAEIEQKYDGSCFIPLNKRGSKGEKRLYREHLLCDAKLAMHKDGTCVKQGIRMQKFCCPLKNSKYESCPCNHKNFSNNSEKHRGCVRWLPKDLSLRLQINRETRKFKRIYAMRTESERYNSRFKSTGTENPSVRNANSVKNLNLIAHISLLTVAITATKMDAKLSTIAMKSLKRAC